MTLMQRLHDTFFKIQEALLPPHVAQVASQNGVPATTSSLAENNRPRAPWARGSSRSWWWPSWCLVIKEFLRSLNQTTFSNGRGPHGGAGAVYENLRYMLSLEFASGYPHGEASHTPLPPQRDTQGNICLDILKDKWSILYDVRTILLSIRRLLGEPNVNRPLNIRAAELWKNTITFKKYLQEGCLGDSGG